MTRWGSLHRSPIKVHLVEGWAGESGDEGPRCVACQATDWVKEQRLMRIRAQAWDFKVGV